MFNLLKIKPILESSVGIKHGVAPVLISNSHFSHSSLPRLLSQQTEVQPTPEHLQELETFLNVIGKSSIRYLRRFESFQEFLELPQVTMRKRGIPTAERRYLLEWREKYKQGSFNPHDLQASIFRPSPRGSVHDRYIKPFQTSHGRVAR